MTIGGIDLVDLLFTYQGRVNRGKYWLAALVFFIAWIAVGIVAWILAMVAYFLGAIVAVLMLLATVVCGVFVGIKRLHDRDKTGWWLLFFYLVPAILDGIANMMGSVGIVLTLAGFAISIWAFVELGCLRGTIGSNQYGPDPLEGRG
jgi:uncharacterized membrane protein YhaH (DUF805 family)